MRLLKHKKLFKNHCQKVDQEPKTLDIEILARSKVDLKYCNYIVLLENHNTAVLHLRIPRLTFTNLTAASCLISSL